ncbi:uncharacterized protein BJX67DRAFT_385505 [Aspergillus lucknowensis]|uniref:S-adenosyl-L-methionine-dependent methyltransferase n=1 Tax=Aspergillus lucknowensis TaxID=176173 RepID=A0ABR4LGT8_9EURO
MAPIEDGEYMIGRNAHASARLNLQHYWVEETCGYLLHPDIPVPADAKIADLATGTGYTPPAPFASSSTTHKLAGANPEDERELSNTIRCPRIWPLSLALRVPPTVQIDGFDIVDDQYPPRDWLPPNVSLNTLDTLKPIPKDLKGKYDVVCMRLFGVLVKNDDPRVALRNMVDMLKPGGYIQWVEVDLSNLGVAKSVHSPIPGKTVLETRLEDWRKYLDSSKLIYSWLQTLPEMCKAIGMSDAKVYNPPTIKASMFTGSMLVLGAWEEYSYMHLDRTPDEFLGDGKQLRRTVAEIWRELRAGVALDLPLYVTVGRK